MAQMKDGDILAAAEELRILMLIVGKLAGRDVEKRLASRGFDISPMQFGVMRLLAYQNHTISEMSKKMMITPATLVPVIDTLERHGYLTREQDPHDRRRTPLSLTDSGRHVVSQIHMMDFDHALYRSLAEMGSAKSRHLLALMRELAGEMTGDADIACGIAKEAKRQAEILMKVTHSRFEAKAERQVRRKHRFTQRKRRSKRTSEI